MQAQFFDLTHLSTRLSGVQELWHRQQVITDVTLLNTFIFQQDSDEHLTKSGKQADTIAVKTTKNIQTVALCV